MGETAENVARQWVVSREEQDVFGLASQEKYFAALAAGKWAAEIAPVEMLGGKQEKMYFDTDEQPRRSHPWRNWRRCGRRLSKMGR